jgi:hypothetical protein
MAHRSSRWYWALALPLCLALVAGCVERRMVITTEPFGAIVYDERNVPLSASPADHPFTYYGKYRFKIVKDGYETLVVEENVQPPWYEWLGLDFVSETLLPWTLRDVRRFHYKLQPVVIVPPETVLEQGKLLRARGLTVGEPLPPQSRIELGLPIVNPGP